MLPSSSQVKIIELGLNSTLSPTFNVCVPIVALNSPVATSYEALVGVKFNN